MTRPTRLGRKWGNRNYTYWECPIHGQHRVWYSLRREFVICDGLYVYTLDALVTVHGWGR